MHVSIYSKRLVVAMDSEELRIRNIDNRKLVWIQRSSLTDQACATERELLIVLRRQSVFGLQFLVQPLADRTVGSISTDNNITFIHAIVGRVHRHDIVLLGDVEDSLAKMDLFGRDQFEE